MIGSVTNIALSGLQSAQDRLNNSANNVANVSSTLSRRDGQTVREPFEPQRIDNVSQEPAGVRTVQSPADNPSVPRFDPTNAAADENGITEFPNVNLDQEVVTQQVAKYDFQANLRVLEAADEMTEDLLDITA